MLFQPKSYLKFLLKSSNQHGVHSPFIYGLVNQCFYDKSSKDWYPQYKNYRDSLLNNNTTITIEDFGAGSKALKSKQRKVAEIAKNAGITVSRGELLGRLASYFNTNTILEIGTSLGLATSCLALSNPKATITTLEGCTATATVAIDKFKEFNFKNINTIIGNFNETLTRALGNNKFDLIYFDGNHQKDATIAYFNQCLTHAHNESVFIFDDIYWSKGMKEAWKYIKEHPKVTITIDTFHWGIVFFRKEQVKEHFVVRV